MPIIVKGEGHHIWDSKGKKYFDGLSGLFVVNAGHGRKRLAEVAAKQAEELAFFPIWSYAHPSAIELADRLADYAPGDLNRVFFSTGGGEAVETAFKLAKYYWKLQGRPTKHKVISRAVAYHGTPQGALAITGIPAMKEMFEPVTPGGFRVPNTNFYRADEMGSGLGHDLEAFGQWAANRIEEMILFEGPETVAAVFLEPVQNSGRMLPAAARLLQARAGDLRPVRRAARGRRGHHRLRPHRQHVRLDHLRLRARHDHLREGHDERLLADRRDHRERAHLRTVQARRHRVLSRLHLRRASGVVRRRAGQPRHLRGGEAQRERAGRTRRSSARRSSSSSTCRSSATCAARAISSESSSSRTRRRRRPSTTTSRSACCAGFLSKALFEAGLYCRADDRGDPVVQLAPPLTIGPPEIREIGEILRGVLSEASSHL